MKTGVAVSINFLHPGKTFCRLLIFFFQNQLFRKLLSGIPSECQTDWIQIRSDVLSDLIWVQAVCKGYQQTTLGGKELVFMIPITTEGRLYHKLYAPYHEKTSICFTRVDTICPI